MAFSIYCLIVSCVLFTNAVAIVNERFLRRCQFERTRASQRATTEELLEDRCQGIVD